MSYEKVNNCVIKLSSPKPDSLNDSYKVMKFKNIKNKQIVSFVNYADFKSFLKKIDNHHRK